MAKERTRPKAHKVDQFLVLNYSFGVFGFKPHVEEHVTAFADFNAHVSQELAQKPGLHAYAASVPNDFKALVVYEVKDPKNIEDFVQYTSKTLNEARKKHPLVKTESTEDQETAIQLVSVGLVDRKTYEKDISDKVNSITLK